MTEFAAIVFPVGLLAMLMPAVRHDLLEHRIPNELVIAGFAVGLTLHGLAAGLEGLAFSAAGASAGLLALLPFHLLKGMSAGDVKLMAAVGAFLGPKGAVLAAAATLVFGCALAIAVIVSQRHHSASARLDRVLAEESGTAPPTAALRKRRFPYAVAIACGALVMLWAEGRLHTLVALP